MRRSAVFVLALGVLSLGGCTRRLTSTEARKMLESPDPLRREEGAAALRTLYAKDPKAFGDHGEQYWADIMKQVPGAPPSEQLRLLAGTEPRGGEGGGGGFSQKIKLDDFWSVFVWGTQSEHQITGYDPVWRDVTEVYVDRPPTFTTGAWTLYYVNGAVYDVYDLHQGVLLRDRLYHDNGRLKSETVYANGHRHGRVITYFADGTIEREESYAEGKQVGVRKWFYPNGKLREEDSWANDTRNGRATFYAKDGARQSCIDYDAGVEVGRGCY